MASGVPLVSILWLEADAEGRIRVVEDSDDGLCQISITTGGIAWIMGGCPDAEGHPRCFILGGAIRVLPRVQPAVSSTRRLLGSIAGATHFSSHQNQSSRLDKNPTGFDAQASSEWSISASFKMNLNGFK